MGLDLEYDLVFWVRIVNLAWLMFNICWLITLGVKYYWRQPDHFRYEPFGVAVLVWCGYGLYNIIEILILDLHWTPRSIFFYLANAVTTWAAWRMKCRAVEQC